jgi:hypothetical protein
MISAHFSLSTPANDDFKRLKSEKSPRWANKSLHKSRNHLAIKFFCGEIPS